MPPLLFSRFCFQSLLAHLSLFHIPLTRQTKVLLSTLEKLVFTIAFGIIGCLFSPGLAYFRKTVAIVAFLVHFMVG